MIDPIRKYREEAEIKRSQERKRLLAIDEYESYALTKEEQYDRSRFLREQEAMEFLKRVHQVQKSIRSN